VRTSTEVAVDFIRIASLAEIPDGEVRSFETPTGRIAVAQIEARLFAFGDDCTHAGCSLAEGALDDRHASIECPCHGSVFDVETGEPIDGPAVDPVPVFSVQIDDGWVEVASRPTEEA
jgi:3-phenylpropionate/trans-cinnamate dioxygenase ferredoxin subunit